MAEAQAKMKALILIILLAGSSFGQITVSHSFVDDATKSFIEVRALRELEDARKNEIAAKDQQILLLQQLVEAKIIQNNVLLAQNRDLSKLKCDDFALIDLKIIKIGHIKRCK